MTRIFSTHDVILPNSDSEHAIKECIMVGAGHEVCQVNDYLQVIGCGEWLSAGT